MLKSIFFIAHGECLDSPAFDPRLHVWLFLFGVHSLYRKLNFFPKSILCILASLMQDTLVPFDASDLGIGQICPNDMIFQVALCGLPASSAMERNPLLFLA